MFAVFVYEILCICVLDVLSFIMSSSILSSNGRHRIVLFSSACWLNTTFSICRSYFLVCVCVCVVCFFFSLRLLCVISLLGWFRFHCVKQFTIELFGEAPHSKLIYLFVCVCVYWWLHLWIFEYDTHWSWIWPAVSWWVFVFCIHYWCFIACLLVFAWVLKS